MFFVFSVKTNDQNVSWNRRDVRDEVMKDGICFEKYKPMRVFVLLDVLLVENAIEDNSGSETHTHTHTVSLVGDKMLHYRRGDPLSVCVLDLRRHKCFCGTGLSSPSKLVFEQTHYTKTERN